MDTCKYELAWVGRCKRGALLGHDYCETHARLVCVVTGKQAIRECDHTLGALICGQPIGPGVEHCGDGMTCAHRCAESDR
jgi:hypothetical protein